MENEMIEYDDDRKIRNSFYGEGKCPDCGGRRFLKGPQGGLSVNIKCSRCGSKFNICPEAKFIQRIGDQKTVTSDQSSVINEGSTNGKNNEAHK